METDDRIVAQRLAAQRISRPAATAAELVAWMGAMQAQDFAAARWALGLRLPVGATDEAVEATVSDGHVLRIHAMRGTWQFVSPADVRWILALVGPVVVARATPRWRSLGLDAATLRRSLSVLERTLADGQPRTRAELAAALARARIATRGRLSHVLGHAELVGLVTSGPRRGKQTTHVLLDSLAPPSGPIDLDAARADLALRYFRSRGPATLADFVWWSGLPAASARAALESIRESVSSVSVGGRTYYRGESGARRLAPAAYLVPTFDEYLVAYRHRADVLDPSHAPRLNDGGGLLAPCVVVEGRVVATWTRVLDRRAVTIHVQPFGRLSSRDERRITAAAALYARFLGLEPRLRWSRGRAGRPRRR